MGKATSETSNTTILPFNNIDINFDMFTVPESDIANIPISGDGENSDRINSSIFSIISIDENGEFHTYCSKICNVCWLTFDNDESLSNHKLNCRPPEFPTSPVKTPVTTDTKRCKKCKLLFPNRDSILAHVRECAKTELEEMANRMKLNSSQEKVPKLSNNQKPVTNEWKYTKSPLGKKPVNSIYPRECQICKKTYLNKFSFYHHKKWCNGADNKHENEIPKIQYPRICTFCGKSCGSKFTFFRHKKQCIKQWSDANANAELANENGNEVTNIGILDTNERSDQNMQIAAQPESNHRNETIVESESHNDETLESRYSIDFVDSNTIASSENTSQENYASQSLDDDGKSLDESENEEDPFDDRCFEEICAYPKLCVHCQMFFADDLEYEQHKQNCFGFAAKNKSSKITYPRKCDICFNWYKSKETFIRHKKSCSPEWSKDRILPMYPRVCQFCRKTYATKHTFHAHKQRCIPVSPIILTNDQNSNYSTPSPCESLITYPRECENCLGTFQNADTFNAHKIRCDFFEPGIENENRNVFSQLNCEHCRNILGQYRRIFHQHIRQCDEPMFSSFRQKQLYQNAVPPFSPKSAIPSLTNEIIQISNETSTKAYPRGTHFCDCCGEFFTTAKNLEDHKRSVRSSTETLENLFDSFSKYQEVDNANVNNFKCGTCLEIFVNAECLEEHKRKCLPKFANTFYPRICECCNKIMKTEQIFYNHKQFCHPNCLKIFVRKDCEICSTSFKCEKLFLQHKLTCNVSLDNVSIGAEYEVLHSECDISI